MNEELLVLNMKIKVWTEIISMLESIRAAKGNTNNQSHIVSTNPLHPGQARSEDFKRGGGEISNVVVFKKILKN